MKILMLTPYLPYPPSSGGQIRSYNLIKQLSKKHEITLYSLIKHNSERQYVPELEKYCRKVKVFSRPQKPWTLANIFKTGTSLQPFLVIRNFSEDEKQDVAKVLAEETFDIIHAETFYVSPHIPKTDVPIVLVDQTIEYQVYQHFVENFRLKFLKPVLGIDVLKIKFWETYYWKKAAKVVAVSDADAKKMKELVPGLDVSVVPNGVGEDLMEATPLHFSKKVLFMGNYAWLQNIEAAKILANEVFPKILAKEPEAKLVIAGQHTERIGEIGSLNIELRDLAIEDVNGVKRAYQESGVLVAPLYGPGGTRLKILGAMAAKLPVVTTHIGIEGIDAKNGETVLFGKTSGELADMTVKLLRDKKLYEKIAGNARKLVEERYSYPAIACKLDAIYQEACSGKN
ncbi:MAG: Glycosyl transferase group 1 [Candidatus Daviesbacteria bacterium GW2011_GWA1_42_6]|uniref:Glycosyl transferase group 1 n=1 Tax=Candidatus Daviesbacteria bacterium GW2011_GWA1_42_6 TaxID=1618420 RepID=A0A0G1D3A0_9BACT|nr:MAG: Glycosyl transferase group 1 [Candidatus Daviesbacteria bacterium GW2011_GWA1_42_6]